jgi:hypothetical protein
MKKIMFFLCLALSFSSAAQAQTTEAILLASAERIDRKIDALSVKVDSSLLLLEKGVTAAPRPPRPDQSNGDALAILLLVISLVLLFLYFAQRREIKELQKALKI